MADSTWWIPLVEGVALFGIGLFALFNPTAVWAITLFSLGIYWLISGFFATKSAIAQKEKDGRVWPTVRGLGTMLLGGFAVSQPFLVGAVYATFISSVIGVGAMLGGAVQLFNGRGSGSKIGFGIFNILLGALIIFNPIASFELILMGFAALALIGGVALSAMAFQIKSFAR